MNIWTEIKVAAMKQECNATNDTFIFIFFITKENFSSTHGKSLRRLIFKHLQDNLSVILAANKFDHP